MLPWLIGALAAAGAALWALVERNRATKALAAADRWHNAYDLAAAQAASAADELRAEREVAENLDDRVERASRLKTDRIIALEEQNAKLLRILAAVDPAAAALAVGDVLDGVLQAPPGRTGTGDDPTVLRPATTATAANAAKGG